MGIRSSWWTWSTLLKIMLSKCSIFTCTPDHIRVSNFNLQRRSRLWLQEGYSNKTNGKLHQTKQSKKIEFLFSCLWNKWRASFGAPKRPTATHCWKQIHKHACSHTHRANKSTRSSIQWDLTANVFTLLVWHWYNADGAIELSSGPLPLKWEKLNKQTWN